MKNFRQVCLIVFIALLQIAVITGLTGCHKEEAPPVEEKPEFVVEKGQLVGINLPQSPKQVYWSRDGDEIVIRCSRGVYAINISTDSIRMINDKIRSVYAIYSKDGKYLYYVSKGSTEGSLTIGRLDLNEGTTRILVENSVAGPLIVSNDHEKIAFLLHDIPEPSIFIYLESTGNIHPFVSGIPRSFNHEGTKMIVRDENEKKIYLVNMEDKSKTDLKLDMAYKYKYFWNGDRIFVLYNGRIRDVFNKTSRTTNLEGVLGRSWTRSMTFEYYCTDELCDKYYLTYYLINDDPYLKKPFATAIAYNFGFPIFAPDEQHAAYIINSQVYICELPF